MDILPESVEGLSAGNVAILGIPFDAFSSFMRGAAEAPTRIREALHAGSSNFCAENGVDLAAVKQLVDVGDLAIPNDEEGFLEIESAVSSLLQRDAHVLSLGGDHSVSFPIVKAHSASFPRFDLLHLDAHPDLYDSFEGNPYSHACPFARIIEEGLVGRLVQVGIRTMNPHQQRQADRFGVEVIEARNLSAAKQLLATLNGPLYLSLDMDVLDPAFAPGVSHHEPGGLSTRQVIEIIQQLEASILGADIVEFNPRRDPLGITAMAAAKLLKEIVARMLELA